MGSVTSVKFNGLTDTFTSRLRSMLPLAMRTDGVPGTLLTTVGPVPHLIAVAQHAGNVDAGRDGASVEGVRRVVAIVATVVAWVVGAGARCVEPRLGVGIHRGSVDEMLYVLAQGVRGSGRKAGAQHHGCNGTGVGERLGCSGQGMRPTAGQRRRSTVHAGGWGRGQRGRKTGWGPGCRRWKGRCCWNRRRCWSRWWRCHRRRRRVCSVERLCRLGYPLGTPFGGTRNARFGFEPRSLGCNSRYASG